MWEYLSKLFKNTDWGSVIVGSIALIFIALTLFIQRKHNRLSVKPIAIFSLADYENEVAVYLQNKGTGPLIIDYLNVVDTKNKIIKNSIIDYFDNYKSIVWTTFLKNIEGWAILPGESLCLIKLNGDHLEPEFIKNKNEVREVLASLELQLQCKDIYNRVLSRICAGIY